MKSYLVTSTSMVDQDDFLTLIKPCVKHVYDFTGERQMSGKFVKDNLAKFVEEGHNHLLLIEVKTKKFAAIKTNEFFADEKFNIIENKEDIENFDITNKDSCEFFFKIAKAILRSEIETGIYNLFYFDSDVPDKLKKGN